MSNQKAPHRPWTLKEFIEEIKKSLKKEGIKVSVPSQFSDKKQTLVIAEEDLETIREISDTLRRLKHKHRIKLYQSSYFSIYGMVKPENGKLKIKLQERRHQ